MSEISHASLHYTAVFLDLINMIISFVTPKDTQFQLDFSFAKTNVTDGHKDSK